jgi:hypothetical protein
MQASPRINLRSSLIQKRFGSKGGQLDEPFEKIASHAAHFFAAYGLSRFVSLELENALQAQLRLHPSEDTAKLAIDDEELVIDIRTAVGGPGYHRAAVLFLDSLSMEFGMEWYARDTDAGDVTGYRDSRNFDFLQTSMRKWMKGQSQRVLEAYARNPGYLSVSLHESLGRALLRLPDGMIGTPFGLRHTTYFEVISGDDLSGGVNATKDAFAWWDEVPDADHWLKAGLQILWTDVPWRAPAIANDQQMYEDAFFCFERAKSISDAIKLPEVALVEAHALFASRDPWLKPLPEGIGYLRREIWRALSENWVTPLPGYWHWSVDDKSVAYWFDSIRIEGTVLNVEANPSQPDRIDFLLFPNDNESERRVREKEAYSFEVKTFEHQGVQKPHVIGTVVNRTSKLVLSVFVVNENDIEFARNVIRRTRWLET